MKVRDIVAEIENIAPLSFQEKYDNSGLVVGSLDSEVSKIILALDVTEDVIDEAINFGAELIISHHPLIFSGLKSVTGETYIERCVIKAIRSGISIYSSHTNIDSVIGGVSYKMAERVGLQGLSFLSSEDGENRGFGVVGELIEAMPLSDFLDKLKFDFNLSSLRYTSYDKKIKRVALCGGSGASLIGCALNKGVDAYVTGDIKYHDFFNTEKRLSLIDIGHFESEQCILDVFYDIISKKIPNFANRIKSIKSNPVNYL